MSDKEEEKTISVKLVGFASFATELTLGLLMCVITILIFLNAWLCSGSPDIIDGIVFRLMNK